MTNPRVPATEADREAIDRAERFAKSPNTTPEEHDDIMVAVGLARLALASSTPAESGEATLVRISEEQFPEIIQAARWMDDDNGTPHFEPGVGFIVDDPEGLSVPTRWLPHLETIETALAGLDHEQPHPLDVDTLEWLAREAKQPTLFESAAHCFVSGEHTPVAAMANSSEALFIANRFFNERFEGWEFDPAAAYTPTRDESGLREAWHRIAILRRALAWHGEPQRMATTREEWQQEVDDAIAWVKANPESDRPSFPSLAALATNGGEGQ